MNKPDYPTPTPEAMAAAKQLVASTTKTFRQLGFREEKPEIVAATESAFAQVIDAAFAPKLASLEAELALVAKENRHYREIFTESDPRVWDADRLLTRAEKAEQQLATLTAQGAKWRDIETAPRDGTWILVTGGEVDDGWYGTPSEPPAVVAMWEKGEGWMFCDWDGALRSEYENPTHWMPLPATDQTGRTE